jgi:hypothetical protein
MMSAKYATLLVAALGIMIAPRSGIPSEAAPEGPMVRLTLYRAGCTVIKGETIDLIVEIANVGQAPVKIVDDVALERLVRPPKGLEPEVAKSRKSPAPSGQGDLHLKLICSVPPGNQARAIMPRNNGRLDRGHVVVIPRGESSLIRVPLPPDAFEVGSCNITAVIVEGRNALKTLEIECVGQN